VKEVKETLKKLGIQTGKKGDEKSTPVDDFLVNYEFYDQ